MAAGATQEQINRRRRELLQGIAREHRGDYVKATAKSAPHVNGRTADGLRWLASVGNSNASNGETFLSLCITVSPPHGVIGEPLQRVGYFGGDVTVPGMILLFRIVNGLPVTVADDGEPGDFRLLLSAPGVSNWFSHNYALTFRGDHFDVLDKRNKTVRTFTGAEADSEARRLAAAFRPDKRPLSRPNRYDRDAYAAADKSEAELSQLRGDALDAWGAARLQHYPTGWTAAFDDWRLPHGPKQN